MAQECEDEESIFINIGRGKSVVTEGLMAALQHGEFAGAGLDVTGPGPLPKDHPLWGYPTVIITPLQIS
ncbi:MAG: NAD(P)-dependent oxidoreductase [Pseudomonadota bacterium]